MTVSMKPVALSTRRTGRAGVVDEDVAGAVEDHVARLLRDAPVAGPSRQWSSRRAAIVRMVAVGDATSPADAARATQEISRLRRVEREAASEPICALVRSRHRR